MAPKALLYKLTSLKKHRPRFSQFPLENLKGLFRLFLSLIITLTIADILIKSLAPSSVIDASQDIIHILNIIALPISIIIYCTGNLDRFLKKKLSSSRLRYPLTIIAIAFTSISLFFLQFEQTYFSLRTNDSEAWIGSQIFSSETLYIFLLFSLVSPTWYLASFVPFCYYLGQCLGFVRAEHPHLPWFIARYIINTLFCVCLSYFQSRIKLKQMYTMNDLEEWNQVYRAILDRNPSGIAVVNVSGKLTYTNEGFKVLNANNNTETFFKNVTNLKIRDLANSFLQSSSNIHVMTNSHTSPTILPFQTQDSILRPLTLLRKKLTLKDTRASNVLTFANLNLLIQHYQSLLEKGQLDNEDQIIFDGKFCPAETSHGKATTDRDNKTQVGTGKDNTESRLGSLKVTLSYEVILRPLPEYKKIILILTDTTDRDLVSGLESNGQYKDKVLASVSHELRTPLNGNLGFLQAAIDDKTVPDNLKERFLVPALRAGKRLKHVIDDILDYSLLQGKGIKAKLEEKSLKDTLNYCCELYDQSFKAKGLKLKLRFAEDFTLNIIRTDHKRLTQIILNLLSNALKFTNFGSVAIEVKPLGDCKAEIKVVDTGLGIKKESIPMLFEEKIFPEGQKNKEIHSKGAGLGLKISQKLSQLLDDYSEGGIRVTSEYGKGSCFRFTVKHRTDYTEEIYSEMSEISEKTPHEYFDDIADEGTENQHNRTMPFRSLLTAENSIMRDVTSYEDVPFEHTNDSSKIMKNPSKEYFNIRKVLLRKLTREKNLGKKVSFKEREVKKVLIVDDDPLNILVLESLLSQFNVPKDSAVNGKEALVKVNKDPDAYGLILMDCQMPVMDGFEATRALTRRMKKGELPKIPIVGCTAFNGQDKLNECIRSGMEEVLAKPVMKGKIGETLRKYLLVNEK